MTLKIKKIINLRDCYNFDLSIRDNEDKMNKYLLREISDNVVEIFNGDTKVGGIKYYPRINHIDVYPSIRFGQQNEYSVIFGRPEPYECHRALLGIGKIVIYDKKIIMKPRVKNLDIIDPYNEEIWDELDESVKSELESKKNIDTIIIKVKSQDEYSILMDDLKEKKYRWMGSEDNSDPKKVNCYIHKDSWDLPGSEKGFYIFLETGKSGKKYISWDERIRDNESHIPIILVKKYIGESYTDLMLKHKTKKAKLKEMTKDFDPYEEEDWD